MHFVVRSTSMSRLCVTIKKCHPPNLKSRVLVRKNPGVSLYLFAYYTFYTYKGMFLIYQLTDLLLQISVI